MSRRKQFWNSKGRSGAKATGRPIGKWRESWAFWPDGNTVKRGQGIEATDGTKYIPHFNSEGRFAGWRRVYV